MREPQPIAGSVRMPPKEKVSFVDGCKGDLLEGEPDHHGLSYLTCLLARQKGRRVAVPVLSNRRTTRTGGAKFKVSCHEAGLRDSAQDIGACF